MGARDAGGGQNNVFGFYRVMGIQKNVWGHLFTPSTDICLGSTRCQRSCSVLEYSAVWHTAQQEKQGSGINQTIMEAAALQLSTLLNNYWSVVLYYLPKLPIYKVLQKVFIFSILQLIRFREAQGISKNM